MAAAFCSKVICQSINRSIKFQTQIDHILLQDSEDKEKTYEDRGKKRIDLVKMKEGEQKKKEIL